MRNDTPERVRVTAHVGTTSRCSSALDSETNCWRPEYQSTGPREVDRRREVGVVKTVHFKSQEPVQHRNFEQIAVEPLVKCEDDIVKTLHVTALELVQTVDVPTLQLQKDPALQFLGLAPRDQRTVPKIPSQGPFFAANS